MATAHLSFLPQRLELDIPKGVGGKLLGVLLVIPFLILVDLGAFYVLALGIATLAHVFAARSDVNGEKRISLNLLVETRHY